MGSRSEGASDHGGTENTRRCIELGANGVIVRCYACPNVRIFTARHALKLFGADTLITDIPARCRVPNARTLLPHGREKVARRAG